MRKLLVLLLGVLFLGALSYFSFEEKKNIIKNDLQTRSKNAFIAEDMAWVTPKILGEGIRTTRTLVLEGTAPSKALRLKAEKVALALEGVKAVKNNLLVTTPVEVVTAEDTKKEEKKKNKDEDKDKKKEKNVKKNTKVKEAVTIEKIVPKATVAYQFIAQKESGGKLTLFGDMPDEKSKISLLKKAKKIFQKQTLVDKLTIKKGVPKEWVESASLGLAQLSKSDFGGFSLTEKALYFSAQVEKEDQKKQIMKEFKAYFDENGTDLTTVYEIDTKAKEEEIKKNLIDNASSALTKLSCQEAFKKILKDDKIQFAFDKASIRSKSFAVLDALASVAKRCPEKTISIEGHSDASGDPAYNKDLSFYRAKAVKKALIKRGVKASKLKAVGIGAERPIADNKTPLGRMKNRRIEFHILDKTESKQAQKSKEKTIPKEVAAKSKEKEKPLKRASVECQNRFKELTSKEKIRFSYSKADILPESYPLLNALVKAAKRCKKEKIIILGHTDSTGGAKRNLQLSHYRAASVKEYFVRKGIPKSSIIAKGMGESKPLVSNDTKENRAKNRRIEFQIQGVK